MKLVPGYPYQKRNHLDFKKLSNLVYVSYYQRMKTRFQKLWEAASKGKKISPLILEEFPRENEWLNVHVEVNHQDDDGVAITWCDVCCFNHGFYGNANRVELIKDCSWWYWSKACVGPHITYARKRVWTVVEGVAEEQHNKDTMVKGEDKMDVWDMDNYDEDGGRNKRCC